MDERTSDSIYYRSSGNSQGGIFVYKLSTAQVVHRNTAAFAHSSDAVARQVEATATNEKMPMGIAFGDRYGNTMILDFDTDSDNDREDDISDDQLDNDHSLVSYESAEQGETGKHESDYIGDSDEDYVEDADDEVSVGNPVVDETVENPEWRL